jgi:hypothetical protein
MHRAFPLAFGAYHRRACASAHARASTPSPGVTDHEHLAFVCADRRADRRHPDSDRAAPLNYIVAIYLILIGIMGIFGIGNPRLV